MATTYIPPVNTAGVGISPVLSEFSLPTNASAQTVPNSSYQFIPAFPLPQTLTGTTNQTSYAIG